MNAFFMTTLFWAKILQEVPKIEASFPQKIEQIYTSKKPAVVVFAPHPDDEILCCADTIDKKISRSEKVKIVVVTDGDALSTKNHYASRFYGARRRQESKKAAKELGLREGDVLFLGFPDGGLSQLGVTSFISPFTGRVDTPPDAFLPEIPYTRENLEAIIARILDKYRPIEVYIPAQEDNHPDHQFVGSLVRKVLESKKINARIFAYVVHREKRVIPANSVPNEKKLKLINIFRSQFHDLTSRNFLEYFAYIPELFNGSASSSKRK